MAMITKCPACGTQFRIATEQLIARQGKVRCGECQEIFSALKSLVHQRDSATALPGEGFAARELPTQTAPPQNEPPAQLPTGAIAEATAKITAGFSAVPEPSTEPLTEPLAPRPLPLAVEPSLPLPDVDETWARARVLADRAAASSTAIDPIATATEKMAEEVAEKARATTAAAAATASTATIAAAIVPTTPPAAPAGPAPLPPVHAGHPGEEPLPETILETFSAASGASAEAGKAPAAGAPPTPEFIAKAARPPTSAAARWLWSLLALAAVLLLGAQAAHAFRERLVAELSEAKPWIAELCAFTQEFAPCNPPQAKRDASQISIEFHELSSDSKAVLVLSALLRNKAPFTQALPLLEVSLVDPSRQVISRRTLKPAEYLDPAQGKLTELAPNAEAQARLLIKAEGLSAATYNLQVMFAD